MYGLGEHTSKGTVEVSQCILPRLRGRVLRLYTYIYNLPADIVAFVAWNPPNYRKSLSLTLRQKWATSPWWTTWPLSVAYGNKTVLTPLQERHRQLSSFRKPVEQSVVDDLGPNHIWVMHFAGDMDAVDAIMSQKVMVEAKASRGFSVRLSSQHSNESVAHACAKWDCKIASRAHFTSDDEGSKPFDTIFLVRPALSLETGQSNSKELPGASVNAEVA